MMISLLLEWKERDIKSFMQMLNLGPQRRPDVAELFD
jgi:hypothetical protein